MSQSNLDRRRFIHSTAALSAGLTFGASAIGNAASNTAETIHAALIGAGTQGQVLLHTCMKIPGIHIQAVSDIWETYNLKQASERILKQYKQDHKAYTDYKEMLSQEKGLDAVLIATPDFCHAEQTEACLKAGLHVYCESPMSNSLDGARTMARTAKETGKLLQIGHQRRSNPRYNYCFDHIINETKLLGQLTAINGQWNRSVMPDRGWPRRTPVDADTLAKNGFESMTQFRNWRWYKNLGGGPLADLGAHQIDVFNWYMNGVPQSVLASGGVDYYKPDTHECPDTVMAVLEYENKGKIIRALYQTINTNSNFGYYESFLGDEGTLHVSEAAGRAAVYREPSAPDWEKWVKIGILKSPEEEEKPEESDSDAIIEPDESVGPPSYNLPVTFSDPIHQPHLENFFNAVRGQGQLHCPPEMGLTSMAIISKINESIATNQKITIDPADYTI